MLTLFTFISFVVFDYISNLYYIDTNICLENNLLDYYDRILRLFVQLTQIHNIFNTIFDSENNYKYIDNNQLYRFKMDTSEIVNVYHHIKLILHNETKIWNDHVESNRTRLFMTRSLTPKIESVGIILVKLEQMASDLNIYGKFKDIQLRYSTANSRISPPDSINKLPDADNMTDNLKRHKTTNCVSSIRQSIIHFVFFHFVGVLWTRDSLVSRPIYHIKHRLVEDLIGLLFIVCFAIFFEFDCDYNLCANSEIRNIYTNVYVEFILFTCIFCIVLSNVSILCLLLWDDQVFITVTETIRLFLPLSDDQGWCYLFGLADNKLEVDDILDNLDNLDNPDNTTINHLRSQSYDVGVHNNIYSDYGGYKSDEQDGYYQHWKQLDPKYDNQYDHHNTKSLDINNDGMGVSPLSQPMQNNAHISNYDHKYNYSDNYNFNYYSYGNTGDEYYQQNDNYNYNYDYQYDYKQEHKSNINYQQEIQSHQNQFAGSASAPLANPLSPDRGINNKEYHSDNAGNSAEISWEEMYREILETREKYRTDMLNDCEYEHQSHGSSTPGHCRTASVSMHGHDSVASLMRRASGAPSNRSSENGIRPRKHFYQD